jgi:hypothetical protein
MVFDLLALTLDYQQWKVAMLDATGLAKDALHVHIGLAAFVAARLMWRWRFGWLIAWLFALAFASGGEWFDMRAEAAAGPLQPDAAHWHDIWNTMLWPTVLALVGRWLEPRPTTLPTAEEETPSGEDAEQPLEQA